MNFIRNSFSSLAGFFLTFALGSLIVIFSTTLVLLDSRVVLSTIEKNNTYSIVATEIVPKVLTYALTQRFEEQLPDQKIADKISSKLDKSTFEGLAVDLKKIIENSYLFVIGETEQFEVRLELKNYIPNLQQNLTTAVESLQAEGQLQGLDPNQLNSDLQEANQASIYITQDRIEVTGLQEINTSQGEGQNKESALRKWREAVIRLKETQALLMIVTAVLAIVLFATRLPHFLSGFKWIATTMLSAAFFPLVLSILLIIFKPVNLISRFLKEQESVANFGSAVDLFSVNLQVILEKIFLNILTISAVLIVSAILIHILVFFLSKRTKAHHEVG